MKKRERLDEMLCERGLAESRSHAKALILAGKVRSGSATLDKPGKEYPREMQLSVIENSPYVSRGGDKLAGYFAQFPWPLTGKRFLDIGASTGGFSDYLLQHGASEGCCVDVGHGQLHYRLRQDPRIHNRERINARNLQAAQLPHPDYPLIVMDVSFISLKRVLQPAWQFLQAGGLLVALIKPQFEAGREEADRGRGVISDDAVRLRVRQDIIDFVAAALPGSRMAGICESPLHGSSGNREYLGGWIRDS